MDAIKRLHGFHKEIYAEPIIISAPKEHGSKACVIVKAGVGVVGMRSVGSGIPWMVARLSTEDRVYLEKHPDCAYIPD